MSVFLVRLSKSITKGYGFLAMLVAIISQSAALFHIEMSQQLVNGLPLNLVQVFMAPR